MLQIKQLKETEKELREAFENAKWEREEEKAQYKLQIKQLKKTEQEKWSEAFDDLKCKRKEEKAQHKRQYEELKTKEAELIVSLITTLDDLKKAVTVRDELQQRIKEVEEERDQLKG